MMYTPCVFQQRQRTILCFSFDRSTVLMNGSLQGLGAEWQPQANPVSQNRFQPWCSTRNDGGELMVYYNGFAQAYDHSWGFCTSKARLPGAGYNYDDGNLSFLTETFNKVSSEFKLEDLTGCSNIPLILKGNTAGRWVHMRPGNFAHSLRLSDLSFCQERWWNISWDVQRCSAYSFSVFLDGVVDVARGLRCYSPKQSCIW